MKKLIILTAALGLCAVSAFAQGQLTVANTATLVTTNVNGTTGAAASSASNFKVQLFYQPTNSTAPAMITISNGVVNFGSWESMSNAPIISIFPSAGKFSGGTESTGGDVAPDGGVWLEMVGWNGGYTSLGAALNTAASNPALLVGVSGEWGQLSGSGAPGTPATIGGFFPGMSLSPVPEPSVMILSGLGAAAMLLYRRKK